MHPETTQPRIDRQPAVETLGTVLGVWAHPDDEAFLSAGLMALSRRQGQRVVVVSATDGELGNPDPSRWTPAEVAAVRRRELAASLAALDVREHIRVGIADGGCDRVTAAHGTALVGQVIDTVRPDTIVTFGPDGMTGHPDHRAISAWTTAAWSARGSQARLWYATLTPAFHRRWGEVNQNLSIFEDGCEPPSTPDHELAYEVRCEGTLLERKVLALRSHRSQVGPLVAALGSELFAAWWAGEAFVDARRPLAGPTLCRPDTGRR